MARECIPKTGFVTGETYCAIHGRMAGWPCRHEELAVIESEDFADLIRPYVEAALQLDRDMIERACEQSLQGGKHGVLVLRSGQAGPVVSAEVDESVPYGQIHERPFDIDGA